MSDFSRYRDPRRSARTATPAGLLFAAVSGLATALPAHADNPGYDRPGLGFTPQVLAAGDTTLEQGLPTWTRDRAAGTTQALYTTDSLLRLGIGGPFELQLGSSPFNTLHENGAGQDRWFHGRGDSVLGLKYAPSPRDAAFTWGLLGSVEFTDGAAGIRDNRRQYLLGADLDWQLGEADAVAAYLEEVRSGGGDRATLAFNESHALTGTLTGYVEAALVRESGVGRGTMAGAGVAWMLGRRVQLDGGFRRGLGGHAEPWMASLGVSVFFGRLP